jgi:membrane-associated phospholipid phosphatase
MFQRPRTALIGALCCIAALVAIGLVSHLLYPARRLDADLLDALARTRGHEAGGALDRFVHLCDPLPYLLMAAVVVLAALARRRPRVAVIVAVVTLLAPPTAEILKLLTAQARTHSAIFADHISRASWPSGHATAATALALCAVLVAPPRARGLVALAGALFAVAIGYALIVLAWHFPSDVLGAYFLAAAWAMLGVAAMRRWPDPVREGGRSPLRSGVAVAGGSRDSG